MLDRDLTAVIERDPRFHVLQRARSRLAWTLVAIVLGSFYSFILTVAYRPALFAAPLHAGTTLTVGLTAGLAIIFLSIGLTGLYVWRANRDFDRITQEILDDAARAIR